MVTALSSTGKPKPPTMSGILEENGMGKRYWPDWKGRSVHTPPEPPRGFADARMTARSRDSSGLIDALMILLPEG